MKFLKIIPMIKKVKIGLSLIFFIVFAADIYCQSAEKMLVKADIDKFVKKMPELINDFKEKGAEIDAKEGEITYPEAFLYSREFHAILDKRGVTEDDFRKFAYIVQGYAVIKYNEAMDENQSELDEAIAMMENNPHLTEEQIEQIKASMQTGQQAMDDMEQKIHPSDLDLIRSEMNRIDTVIKME